MGDRRPRRLRLDFGSSASVVDGRAFALLTQALVATTDGYRRWQTVRVWRKR